MGHENSARHEPTAALGKESAELSLGQARSRRAGAGLWVPEAETT